ncbi:hypothetical protein HDU80_010986, partial [Chytriomyces hyalinus]
LCIQELGAGGAAVVFIEHVSQNGACGRRFDRVHAGSFEKQRATRRLRGRHAARVEDERVLRSRPLRRCCWCCQKCRAGKRKEGFDFCVFDWARIWRHRFVVGCFAAQGAV